MPSYSKSSAKKLATCDERLQRLFAGVLVHWDHTILEGYRDLRRQRQLFMAGKSRIDGISRKGKHNFNLSRAVDVAPYDGRVIFDDTDLIIRFANFVLGYAASLGIKMRWGGDWDKDRDRKDQTFNDLVHFELED